MGIIFFQYSKILLETILEYSPEYYGNFTWINPEDFSIMGGLDGAARCWI